MAEDQQKTVDAPEETNSEETPQAEAPATEEVTEETAPVEAAEDTATEDTAVEDTATEDTPEEATAEVSETEEAPAEAEPAEEPATAEAEETPAVEETVEVEQAEEAAEAAPAAEAEKAAEAEEAAEATPEPAAETVAEEVIEEPRTIIGYTGEIEGEVIKLEDLEKVADEESITNYDELMQMIDETLTNVSENEIVSGKIVSIGEKDIVIDIGFKSDGIVSKNEFSSELNPGDEVEVYLERIEDYHGQLVLSKTKADTVKRWMRIETAHTQEEVLEGTIVRRIKGGMIVELFDGVEAFLPGSQIDVRPVRDFDAYLDKKMEFKIVKLNPVNENIVVSHKALIEKDLEQQRQNILSSMESGQVLEGSVKNITDFGVFIDLGGVDGLLHITDLSWGRVSHPSELVELDQKLNVVVLDYDKDRQRISLGLKQLQSHPWENIGEKYNEEDGAEGKVVSITDYGAFVELEKGIEGLVHISEMSWTEHIKHPSQMVSLGQVVKVKILNIDHEGKKISLGMKQLEPDPWDGIAERYPSGTVLRGKVRNITNFGVFVEIEAGIDGLVHISDLSWTKKIKHPAEYVKKGQELDVVIINIDESERRISLGHKQIETNPWNDFAKIFAVGTDLEVPIKRFLDNALEVDLGFELEGTVPASELKTSGKGFKSAYKEGDVLELRVIKFDSAQKEIVLSEVAKTKAVEKAKKDEEVREKRAEQARERQNIEEFKQKAKKATGPTTLGELSGLEDLKRQMEEAEKAEAVAARQAATDKKKSKKDDEPAEEAAEAVAEVEAPAEEAPAEEAPAEEAPVEEAPAEEAPATEAEAATEEAEAPAEEPAAEEAPAEAAAEVEAPAEEEAPVEEAPAEEAPEEEAPAAEEAPEEAVAEEKPKKKRATKKKTKAKDDAAEAAEAEPAG